MCAKPLLPALATVAPLAQPTHLGQMSPQKHQATTATPTHTPLIPATDPTFGKISPLANGQTRGLSAQQGGGCGRVGCVVLGTTYSVIEWFELGGTAKIS